MIENFTNHAANERTFLSWVRTSIAIFVFGFIIEKFDLLQHQNPLLSFFLGAMGLILMIAGSALLLLALISFRQNSHFINNQTSNLSSYLKRIRLITIGLAVVVFFIFLDMLLYLVAQFL